MLCPSLLVRTWLLLSTFFFLVADARALLIVFALLNVVCVVILIGHGMDRFPVGYSSIFAAIVKFSVEFGHDSFVFDAIDDDSASARALFDVSGVLILGCHGMFRFGIGYLGLFAAIV
jgi:hypothetical protein